MNPSQNTALPPGLELPVLTDVVDEPALPMLVDEEAFELPDFDFSSELDAMKEAIPGAGAVELEIPELPLEDVLEEGTAPMRELHGVDFSSLPSLDLETGALEELALDDVLPVLSSEVAPHRGVDPSVAEGSGAEAFDFELAPAALDDWAAVPEVESPLPEVTFAVDEPAMSWLAVPTAHAEMGTIPTLSDEFGAETAKPQAEMEEEASQAAEVDDGVAPVLMTEAPLESKHTLIDVEDGVPPVLHALEGGAGPFDAGSHGELETVKALASVETVSAAPATQSIAIDSLPTGVLGGGVGPEPTESSSWPLSSPHYAVAGMTEEKPAVSSGQDASLLHPVKEAADLPKEETASSADVGAASMPLLAIEADEGLASDMEHEGAEMADTLWSARIETDDASPMEAEGGITAAVPLPLLDHEAAPVLADEASRHEELLDAPSGEGVVTLADERDGLPSDQSDVGVVPSSSPTHSVVPERLMGLGVLSSESGLLAATSAQKDPIVENLAPVRLEQEEASAGESESAGRKTPSCAVVNEQALIDSLTQKILPRMKVELSLWLQDALEMQARQMLSGVMHQLKEDYEMLFNETLRESLRQAISELGRDEPAGKS